MINQELKVSLANLFKARFPYVYISTWEEKRVCDFIVDVATDEALIRHPRQVYVWTQTNGLINEFSQSKQIGTQDPIKAFAFVQNCKEDAIFIFKDLHVYFGVPGRQIGRAHV